MNVHTVWVFNGEDCALPAGVFRTRAAAEEWVRRHGLSGTLSEFPLDVGAYDHALSNGLWRPKKPIEVTPEFVANFCPRLEHEHWQDGERT
jgi:hypothetical protein